MKTKIAIVGCMLASACLTLPSISFAAAGLGRIYINKNMVQNIVASNGAQYDLYRKPEITVITPKQFSFHFYPDGSRAKDVSASLGCSSVLNSTYFGFANGGGFFPAGIWYEFGSFVREPYKGKDINLQVLLASDGKSIDFYDNNGFDFTKMLGDARQSRYMNAGPWLVRDGKIDHNIVNNKSHRQRSATRSAILVNPDGTVKFLIATEPISLPQFIVFAYNTGIGTGAFSLVNLDGGSSTSIITPYTSYKSTKRLPAFICVQ